MKILLNNQVLRDSLRPYNDVGFIPTMGGIHNGHISLIKHSKKNCKKTIVSIFINPKQFDNIKDYKTYPSNLNKDLSILRKTKNVDFVYVPKYEDIYSSKRKTKIVIKKKDKILCAKFRRGHFEGVLDVMDRMTNLIKPKKIFMGKKDFQQLFLVKNFIKKIYGTKIIACETIRNKKKLALSTRNNLLTKKQQNKASNIISKLFIIKKNLKNKKNINKILLEEKILIEKNYNVSIEYLEFRNIKNLFISNKFSQSKIFIAYYIGGVRLIDNF